MSVARMRTSQLARSGSSRSSRMASEYGSSPVEQAALQIRRRRLPDRRSISSGRIWRSSAWNWGRFRKKWVSPTVRSPTNASSAGRPAGSPRCR